MKQLLIRILATIYVIVFLIPKFLFFGIIGLIEDYPYYLDEIWDNNLIIFIGKNGKFDTKIKC